MAAEGSSCDEVGVGACRGRRLPPDDDEVVLDVSVCDVLVVGKKGYGGMSPPMTLAIVGASSDGASRPRFRACAPSSNDDDDDDDDDDDEDENDDDEEDEVLEVVAGNAASDWNKLLGCSLLPVAAQASAMFRQSSGPIRVNKSSKGVSGGSSPTSSSSATGNDAFRALISLLAAAVVEIISLNCRRVVEFRCLYCANCFRYGTFQRFRSFTSFN